MAKHKKCERRMAQRRQTRSELPPRSQQPLNATSRMMNTVAASNGVPKDQDVSVLNAFTVDVEDYFQVSGFENQIPRSSWCGYESRVVANTEKILKLLARHQVQATFFVLGWVADRFPKLVRQIQSAGHSVGSHSFWHHLVYR